MDRFADGSREPDPQWPCSPRRAPPTRVRCGSRVCPARFRALRPLSSSNWSPPLIFPREAIDDTERILLCHIVLEGGAPFELDEPGHLPTQTDRSLVIDSGPAGLRLPEQDVPSQAADAFELDRQRVGQRDLARQRDLQSVLLILVAGKDVDGTEIDFCEHEVLACNQADVVVEAGRPYVG